MLKIINILYIKYNLIRISIQCIGKQLILSTHKYYLFSFSIKNILDLKESDWKIASLDDVTAYWYTLYKGSGVSNTSWSLRT